MAKASPCKSSNESDFLKLSNSLSFILFVFLLVYFAARCTLLFCVFLVLCLWQRVLIEPVCLIRHYNFQIKKLSNLIEGVSF